MIKPRWSNLKDKCYPHFLGVRGSSLEVKTIIAAIVTNSWRIVEEGCRNYARGYKERLLNVVRRDGNNNSRG